MFECLLSKLRRDVQDIWLPLRKRIVFNINLILMFVVSENE